MKNLDIWRHLANELLAIQPSHSQAATAAPLLHVRWTSSPLQSVCNRFEFRANESDGISRDLRKRSEYALIVFVMLQTLRKNFMSMWDVFMKLPLPAQSDVQVHVLRLSSRILCKTSEPFPRCIIHDLQISTPRSNDFLLNQFIFCSSFCPFSERESLNDPILQCLRDDPVAPSSGSSRESLPCRFQSWHGFFRNGIIQRGRFINPIAPTCTLQAGNFQDEDRSSLEQLPPSLGESMCAVTPRRNESSSGRLIDSVPNNVGACAMSNGRRRRSAQTSLWWHVSSVFPKFCRDFCRDSSLEIAYSPPVFPRGRHERVHVAFADVPPRGRCFQHGFHLSQA